MRWTKSLGYHADKVEEIEKQLDEHYEELKSLMEDEIEIIDDGKTWRKVQYHIPWHR